MTPTPSAALARGRFSLIRTLGEGGHGAVFEAHDKELDMRVALKQLSRVTPDALLRFKREFRAFADLRHPNIVRLFELFEQKTSLLHLLDVSQRAQGVQIYIGGESGLVPLDECSVVTASYEVNGQLIGTLGVIGPTRMAYERVIPIVDVTAKLLSNALSRELADD